MTQEIKLPPLPNPAFDDLDDCAMFSSVQMTNYARAAVAADRQYAQHDDYAAAIAHNEYLLARLKKSDAQLAAISAAMEQQK